MTGDYFAVWTKLGERWGWRVVPLGLLFWVVLWPVGTVWLLVTALQRYLALDRSSEARTERRVARLLSLYPGDWRARYGDELAELLREAIRDGRGGPGLTINVVRESAATHTSILGRRGVVAVACCSLAWLPIAQGFVPLAIKLTHGTSRAWFLALYLPSAYQWPVIAAMIAVATLMLAVAVRATVVCNRRRQSFEISEPWS